MKMLVRKLTRFGRDEDGAVTAFIVLMFLTMILATGMAVDFMRQETARADLQNAIDRGALAAASMTQTLGGGETDAEIKENSTSLVLDYMESRTFTSAELTLDVTPNKGLNFRRVKVDAEYNVETFFLKIIGITQLVVKATSTAEQRRNDVEISVVVDVSGSMAGTPLTQLQTAAKEFVATLLKDETVDRTTISLVPYSGQTNASAALASHYTLSTHHSYDYCFVFDEDDFLSTTISTTAGYEQFQHFLRSTSRGGYYGCPKVINQITPLSNVNSDLNTAIENLTAEGTTATYNGMKWGVALLDPTANPAVQGLIADGLVNELFDDRPRAYSDLNILKVVVLMTDGANTQMYRIKPSKYDDYTPDYWHTHRASNSDFEAVINNEVTGEGDDLMHDICFAAHDAGIVVYTIGFNLTPTSAANEKLAPCASTPANHYLVQGVDISSAFALIAADIEKLRLVH